MSNPVLDVDDSIIMKNLSLINSRKEEEQLNNLMKSLEGEKIPSITFRPLPGICIKTRTHDHEKVFINLCHTLEIPPPEDISEEKFCEILNDETPTWRIPMSVGHERFESSKDGNKCLTYDIVVNTNYFKKIQAERHFLTFTILTIITAIESKYDKELDSANYVILKNRKVIGTLHDHRVQKRDVKKPTISKPLIEDISSNKHFEKNVEELKEPKITPSIPENFDNPKYILVMKNPKDDQSKQLIGYFKLPNKCYDSDMDVSVNEDRIIVEVKGFNYLIDIFVPYSINNEKVVATVDSSFQILRLEMPVICR